MAIALITGSNGLVGSESAYFFAKKGFDIVGIDNNLREFFFGKDGSTLWVKKDLKKFYDLDVNSLANGSFGVIRKGKEIKKEKN